MADSVPGQYFHTGLFSTSACLNERMYRSVLFNRCLSNNDVQNLIQFGIDPADEWGVQTNTIDTTTLNGGFETAGSGGADVFANWGEYSAGTGTVSRDTVDFSPNLGSTASAKQSGTDGTAVTAIYPISGLVVGKRYRLTFDAKCSSATTETWTDPNNVTYFTFNVTTSWATYSGEFVSRVNTTGIKLDFSGPNTLWADNCIVLRIGAIVDLDLAIGNGSTFPDRSTNYLDGTNSSAGVSIQHLLPSNLVSTRNLTLTNIQSASDTDFLTIDANGVVHKRTGGFSGYSGYSGLSGRSGYSGFSGLSGYSGVSGTSGQSGRSGYSGYSGFSGTSGLSGASGQSGQSGRSGYSGFSGLSGISGYSGYSGRSGAQGPQGPQGPQSSPSDYRLKENITQIAQDESWGIVKNLQTYHFNFKGSQERIAGFIAHEVQEAGLRQAVIGDKDAMDVEGNPIYQHLMTQQMVPTLWTAMRDVIRRVEALENEIKILKGN
jgi:hypothetical protein